MPPRVDAAPVGMGARTVIPIDPAKPLPNARHEAFCQAYLKTGVASQAYKAAYPKAAKWTRGSLDVEASRLRASPKIAPRIASLQAKAAGVASMAYTEACVILSRMARGEERESSDVRGPHGIVKLRRTDRLQALMALAKLRGWLKGPPQDVNHQVVVEHRWTVSDIRQPPKVAKP